MRRKPENGIFGSSELSKVNLITVLSFPFHTSLNFFIFPTHRILFTFFPHTHTHSVNTLAGNTDGFFGIGRNNGCIRSKEHSAVLHYTIIEWLGCYCTIDLSYCDSRRKDCVRYRSWSYGSARSGEKHLIALELEDDPLFIIRCCLLAREKSKKLLRNISRRLCKFF